VFDVGKGDDQFIIEFTLHFEGNIGGVVGVAGTCLHFVFHIDGAVIKELEEGLLGLFGLLLHLPACSSFILFHLFLVLSIEEVLQLLLPG
jgi:hypothetical protein